MCRSLSTCVSREQRGVRAGGSILCLCSGSEEAHADPAPQDGAAGPVLQKLPIKQPVICVIMGRLQLEAPRRHSSSQPETRPDKDGLSSLLPSFVSEACVAEKVWPG